MKFSEFWTEGFVNFGEKKVRIEFLCAHPPCPLGGLSQAINLLQAPLNTDILIVMCSPCVGVGKIPALLDTEGPGGNEINVFESGSILQYLAEKSGQFLPKVGTAERVQTLNWLNWQVRFGSALCVSGPHAQEKNGSGQVLICCV